MYKVDEKVDWSEKVLGISIDSPIFNEMRDNLNVEIERCKKSIR